MESNLPKPSDRSSTFSLESMPTDALVVILKAVESLADLNAVIRASPSIYECFLSAKDLILLSMVKRDLGPVIRDAVALCLIEKQPRGPLGLVEDPIAALTLYEQVPTSMKVLETTLTDNLIKVLHINRTIQFFIDWFDFAHILALQDISAGWSLSTTERQRIAQGLLRYQILAYVHQRGQHAGGTNRVFHKFSGAFTSWEMQQPADAYIFVNNIRCALFRSRPSFKNRSVPWTSPGLMRMQDSDKSQDLGSLRQSIISACSLDSEVAETIGRCLQSGESACNTFDCLIGSHQIPNRWAVHNAQQMIPHWAIPLMQKEDEAKEELYRREQELPVLVAGELATDPPYGWVDALEGLNCCRWGTDLLLCLPDPPGHITKDQIVEMEEKVARWRLIGFMFWDRERVELVKSSTAEASLYNTGNYGRSRRLRTTHFTGYGTGWLKDIWFDLPDRRADIDG